MIEKIKNIIRTLDVAFGSFVHNSGIGRDEQNIKKNIFKEYQSWIPMEYKNSDTVKSATNTNSVKYYMVDPCWIFESWVDNNLDFFIVLQTFTFLLSAFCFITLLFSMGLLVSAALVFGMLVHVIVTLIFLDKEIIEDASTLLIVGNVSFIILLIVTLVISNTILIKGLGVKFYTDYQMRMIKDAINKSK